MLEHKAFRFRLKPTKQQEQKLLQYAGACRWIYNWGLARKKEYYAEHKKTLGYNKLAVELTDVKKQSETSWLAEMPSQSLQQSLKDLDKAFKNFFEKRAGLPKFKSRKQNKYSFRLPQNVHVKDNAVFVPKIGWVKMKQHRSLEGTIKNATFKRDMVGNWCVVVMTEFDLPDIVIPAPIKAVGLDMGLKDFLVTDSGKRVSPPKFYRASECKLKRAQRQLSRKQKGSSNRNKAKLRVAKLHAKVASQRQDFLHKLSSKLVKQHDAICVEDLCVKGLVRTKLAKSISDAGWGYFRQMLEYKSRWNYKHFVKIGRFFPSSKTCSECGDVNHDLKLSDREWICTTCGSVLDRDLNAAINIKNEGLRIITAGHAENACGADVRLLEREAVGVEAGSCAV